MDRRLIAAAVGAASILAAHGVAQEQAPRGYDALTPMQVRLLVGWAGTDIASAARESAIRQRYDRSSADVRTTFERVTDALASLLLADPENGEVLGATLDVVDTVQPPEEQPGPAADGTLRLAVTLAPGARDRLRRSGEFTRLEPVGTPVVFVHAGPPLIRITIPDADATRGEIALRVR